MGVSPASSGGGADVKRKYRSDVRALDSAAGGEFTTASPADQDAILAR
jgi:hypothetical protein